VRSYDLYIEELTGYSDADITDVFVRMNRFVVKLSPQEIRHAKFSGKFKDFLETAEGVHGSSVAADASGRICG